MRHLVILIFFYVAFSQPDINCCNAQQIAQNNCVGVGCYIPQCTDDCEWDFMQCWSSTGYCWCVDEEGNEIDGTSIPAWQGLPDCYSSIEECIPPYLDIEGHCFHEDDITFLEDMIYNSENSGTENSPNIFMDSGDSWHEVLIDGEYYNFSSMNGIVEPLELGIQEWQNGRLISLMCGAFIYCNLSGQIPASISNLSEINILRLEVNYFSGYVPESICELEQLNYDDYLDFDLSYNQLCPPYPDCIPDDALAYMEPSNCYTLGDINNDYEVNVLDIVHMVGFILMTDYPTNAEFYAGDINSDGQLNVLDIVAIVQLILNPMNEDCYIEPEIGSCDGICPTYYYNLDTNECEEYITGCCGVEAFSTMEACQSVCE